MKPYIEEFQFRTKGGDLFTFKTEPNPLNSNQMWWIEPNPVMFAGTVKQAKLISKAIKDCNTVLLSYEDWLWKNEDLLSIEFAETGADREGDFNLSDALDAKYEKYYEGKE